MIVGTEGWEHVEVKDSAPLAVKIEPSGHTFKVGERIVMDAPPPLTMWDRFLWRWFGITRKRQPVRQEYVVTHSSD